MTKPRVRIRTVGRIYELPPLPPLNLPFALFFRARPSRIAISVDGGPRRLERAEYRDSNWQ
jgi:hypothetical protein